MKSKDLQKLVFSKSKNGSSPAEIFQDFNGAVSLRTISRWRKMVTGVGSIKLSTPPEGSRTARSKGNMQKVKNRLKRKRRVSARKLASELKISPRSVSRILKNDRHLHLYKKTTQPLLTDTHKAKRKKFANWVRTRFRKEDTMRILFSDEKWFDIDGIYNSQNDRVWAAARAEAGEKRGRKQRRKFPQKRMVWLGACPKDVTPLVIFENGTMDHARYIKEVLPVAVKYGNNVFGDWRLCRNNGARIISLH